MTDPSSQDSWNKLILVIFLSGPYSNRQTGAILAIFSEIYLRFSSFSLQGFGKKRTVLVLNDFKSRDWEKIRNLSLETHSQIFGEIRKIQGPAQFYR